ncbi:DUF305 domain-containing protein [Agromyces bauzanensis]
MTAMGRSWRIGTVLALALGMTACTATAPDYTAPSGPIVQLGAPGEPNRTLSPEEAEQLGSPEHVEADVVFMRNMIEHHAQAIAMTGYVEERTQDRDIRLLAERMRVSQDDEIDLMAGWLQDRGQPIRNEGHDAHADGGMPGMLTDEQLARLEASTDAAFDRLFLEYMIQHHQGAVQMVDELYRSGGGQESSVDQFARHVEADQNIEIARMQGMLAERS